MKIGYKKRFRKKSNEELINYLTILFVITSFLLVACSYRLNEPTSIITASASSFGQISLKIIYDLSVNVDSPQNITYNFNKGDNYTMFLNVSSNRNVTNWWYTLNDLKHNITIYSDVFFTPNITFDAVRWDNELIVNTIDSMLIPRNKTLVFFISVPNSAPVILNLPSELEVCQGGSLLYYFNVSDTDEDSLRETISPTYPLAPFYMGDVLKYNYTIYRYEIYSGTLSKSDAGGVNAGYKIYNENISITDYIAVTSGYVNITVIETNDNPVIETIGVQTIWTSGDNSSFNYQVIVNDTESGNQDSGNLTFNISFENENNLFNISEYGVMNFTANSSYIGVHNITICVVDTGIPNPYVNISSVCGEDGSAEYSCQEFSLTVTTQNRAPNITSFYPLNLNITINEGETLYCNLSEEDPDGTIPDAYWYLNNIMEEYDYGSLIDEFSYYFDYNSAGNYTLIAKITDGVLNYSYDYVIWTINVLNATPIVPLPPPPGGGGGGGGGGGFVRTCDEKWGCGIWEQCQSVNNKTAKGRVENYAFLSGIKTNCSKQGWNESFCGLQIRECRDLNNCSRILIKTELRECYYTLDPSCEDNIKNCHHGDCEILIDCGGPCKACPTCNDGIKNQNEEGIDCGGNCNLCQEEIPLPDYLRLIVVFSLIVLFLIALVFILRLAFKYLYQIKEISKIKKKTRS